MKKYRVVFLHGLAKPLIDLVLSPCSAEFEVVSVSGKSPEQEQIDAVGQADFLMIYRANPTDSVLRNCKNVRFIQLLAAGFDQTNTKLVSELAIPCANNGGANSWAVADQAILMILSLYRRLLPVDRDVRAGKWNSSIDGLSTFELSGKLIGVLGLGNIGQKVAKRVQAFEAQVQYFDEFVDPDQVKELGLERVSLEDLFRTSDVVTLHVPLTDSTRHMVNRARLASMKRTAVIINTSRGPIIDEPALIGALQDGQIAGAGLDTFEREPVEPNNPLLGMENVVVSPHSAGTTADTWRRRGAFAFHNFNRVLNRLSPEALIRFGREV